MTKITANIRLRPTRIGFLVRPNDMASLRKIMRVCTSLWGGLYNPIIPVFRTPPKEWKAEPYFRIRGYGVAKGYINFFEPDVFVEAESGLAKNVGLNSLLKKVSYKDEIITLKDFLLSRYHQDWLEPNFGLNIFDVLQHKYETVQRFQLRHKETAVLVPPNMDNGLVEALYGVYPDAKDMKYLVKAYKDVYEPRLLTDNLETWKEVYFKGFHTPLRITEHQLETSSFGNRDLLIFVFDPQKPTDLIDLWNLRLETNQVLPVPIEYFSPLAKQLVKIIRKEHRPVKGNPNGVMHYTTIEFARSIDMSTADELVKLLNNDWPKGALSIKNWRDRVWEYNKEPRISRPRRVEVTANELRTSVNFTKEGNSQYANYETLSPEFASRFGGHDYRWVNVVNLSTYETENIATILPFNIFDRSWPRLAFGESVIIGSEGWVFGQKHKNWTDLLELLTNENAIIGALNRLGIEATLSEPGHIAKQILEHIGGMRGINLIAEQETLQLLNKMAGAVRIKSNDSDTIEETFELRSSPIQHWQGLIAKRKKKAQYRLELENFTKSNIIRLGIETGCPNCRFTNWHSLSSTDYKLACERCLYIYDFPQASISEKQRKWAYRVVGPFSIPDYAKGSYSTLLTIRQFQDFYGIDKEMTFSTALSFKFDGIEAETDFVALKKNDMFGVNRPPELIIGEAKSFGNGDLIKQKDLIKLKAIGQKLPGAIIVISVLREKFTDTEKKRLKAFVNWARRFDEQGYPTNPVILLTGNELFSDRGISDTWRNLGEPYIRFSDYNRIIHLSELAEATQIIHLGEVLPKFRTSQ
jgi:hypothetical protein